MQRRVLDYILENQMIQENDRVIVGVSAGADSVCLLHVLIEVQKTISFTIGVVHVNHGLRGREAGEDEHFVEVLCQKHKIPCEVFSYDVAQIAADGKLSVEEAGRKVRYEAFGTFAKQWGGTKVALAHHKNDQAETMLHNLVRGSAVSGLCGIHPVRNEYIRPLLCMNRAEVEQYLKSRNLSWRTDSTNLQEDYTRNRIRHQVVDYLVREVNAQAIEHMAQAAANLLEVEEYLTSQALLKEEQYKRVNTEETLIMEELASEPPVIQKYVLRHCFEEAAGGRKDLSKEHLETMCQMLQKQVGKMADLPEGMRIRRTYGGVVLEKRAASVEVIIQEAYPLEISGICKVGDLDVYCRVFAEKGERIPQKTYTKWLDYDKIEDNLVIRSRRSGDYIVVCASGGKKKIKDYFIDIKLPKEERDQVLLLAAGSEVIWIIGWRISEKYKINKNTEQILSVQIEGRNIHE